MSIVHCAHCESELQSTAAFCSSCGAPASSAIDLRKREEADEDCDCDDEPEEGTLWDVLIVLALLTVFVAGLYYGGKALWQHFVRPAAPASAQTVQEAPAKPAVLTRPEDILAATADFCAQSKQLAGQLVLADSEYQSMMANSNSFADIARSNEILINSLNRVKARIDQLPAPSLGLAKPDSLIEAKAYLMDALLLRMDAAVRMRRAAEAGDIDEGEKNALLKASEDFGLKVNMYRYNAMAPYVALGYSLEDVDMDTWQLKPGARPKQ